MSIKLTSTAKRVLRWFLIIAFTLLGLVLSGLFLLTLPPGEKLLRQFAEVQLSQFLGSSVEIGELETNLLLHLRANDINIFPAAGAREKPLLHLRSARLEYRLWNIFSQSLRIKSLTLDSLYLNVQRDSSGHFTLFRRFDSPKSDSTAKDSSWQLRLARLSLTNSMIEYDDHFIPLVGKLYDLNVALSSPNIDHYQFQVEADSVHLFYRNEPFTVKQTKINGTVSEKSVLIDSLLAKLPGLDLTGNVLAKLDSTPIPLKCSLRLHGKLQPLNKPLANYLPVQMRPLTGAMDVHVFVEGTTDFPRFDLESEFTNLRIADIESGKANAHLKWENQTARLEQFHAELWGGSLAGNGELTLDSLLTHRLHLKLEAINFRKLWESVMADSLPLAGEVNGELTSQGSYSTLEKLNISSSLSLQHAAFNSQPLDDISATLIVRDGQARLDFQQGKTQILADVDIRTRNPQGAINARVPAISSIAELFGIADLTGAATLKGNISGTFDAPTLDIELTGSNIVFWNFPADTVTGRLVYQNAQFLIAESYLSGSVTEIDSLHPPFDFAGWGGGFHYQGSVSGPVDSLQGKLTADLWRPVLLNYAFDTGNLELSMNDSTLIINSIRLYKDSLQIGASGEYKFSADQVHGQLMLSSPSANSDTASFALPIDDKLAFDFNFADSTHLLIGLRGTDIDLRVLDFFLGEGAMIRGLSTFNLRGEGTLRNPHLHGQFGIREGKIQLRPNAEPIQNFGLQLVFADSVLQIKDISGKAGVIPFRLSGEIIGTAEKQLFAELNLDLFKTKILNGRGTISSEVIDYQLNIDNLNLALFEPLLPQIENLDGLLNSTLSIRGTINDPLILGNLDIDNLSFKPRLLTSPLNRGIIRLHFEQNQVLLDSLFLAMNKGYISAAGNLQHDLGKPVLLDVQLNAQNLNFAEPKSYKVNIKSVKLGYKTQGGSPRLEGDIMLGDSRFIKNIQATDFLNLAKKQLAATLQGPSEEPLDLLAFMKNNALLTQNLPKALQQTQLNLRLRDSDSLWVKNNIAALRMEAELQLIGTPIKPSLAGRVSIKPDGEFFYLDRVFKVIAGTLDFSNPDRANPMVDLNAETKSKPLEEIGEEEEYLITLAVTGPLDDFEYFLTSDPPLEQPDIISLLTLGVTSKSLSSAQSPDGHSAATEALQRRMEGLASQRLAGNISDFTSHTFGRQIGLDRLGVTGDVFDINKARLMASKNINERMEVKYTTSFKRLNDYEVEANFRLWKYLFLEGKTNQKNESQGDLKFRLKFK